MSLTFAPASRSGQVRSGLSPGGRWIRTFGSPFGNDDFRFRTIGGADAWLAGGGLEFAPDSPLGEDGFELSVPGDTIKVLRSLHVVPANIKSARTSSETGEPAVGDRLPIVAHRMNGGGHRRPARSPPRSGDPADRYAMQVLMKLWGARGTESLQTPRWREMDSNFRYRGTKAAAFADLADSAGP